MKPATETLRATILIVGVLFATAFAAVFVIHYIGHYYSRRAVFNAMTFVFALVGVAAWLVGRWLERRSARTRGNS